MPVKQPEPSKDHHGADKDRHPTDRDDKLHEHGNLKDQHQPLAGQPQIDQRRPIEYTEMGEPIGRDYDHSPSGDAEQDPNPSVTKTQTEQVRRSIEIQRVGIDNWLADHDERNDGAVHETARGPWWDRAAHEAHEGQGRHEREPREHRRG